MIDLHCHVLPGIDDGPQTLEDTFALARTAVGNGIHTIVATPHVSWEYVDNTAASIRAKVTEVNAALRDEGIELTVLPGAEVALTRANELPAEELTQLRLGGGPWLLVECPLTAAAGAGFAQVLYTLRAQGHQIVLAHPERIHAFLREPDLLEGFIRDGMLGQVTAGSFSGRFGKDVQKFALHMLEQGWVHNVVSDAHSTRRRPPSIAAELLEGGLTPEHVDVLAVQVPQALLSGGPMPEIPPAPKRKRRLFGR